MSDEDRKELTKKIAFHARALAALMDAPEPGIGSWGEFVRQHMEFLTKWWSGGFADEKEADNAGAT